MRTTLTLLLISFFMIDPASLLSAIGHWLAQPTHHAPADAIIVLGGRSPERMLRGIDLHAEHPAAELWHTGNMPRAEEARHAAQLAVRKGVPETAIQLLATNSTWEDGHEIAGLIKARNIQSIVIVTDWSHSRRALRVIEHHLADSDVTVYYAVVDRVSFLPDNWWRHQVGRHTIYRELVKMVYYWARYEVATWR